MCSIGTSCRALIISAWMCCICMNQPVTTTCAKLVFIFYYWQSLFAAGACGPHYRVSQFVFRLNITVMVILCLVSLGLLMHIWFFVVLGLVFFSTKPTDCLGTAFPEWPVFMYNRSVNRNLFSGWVAKMITLGNPGKFYSCRDVCNLLVSLAKCSSRIARIV